VPIGEWQALRPGGVRSSEVLIAGPPWIRLAGKNASRVCGGL
jgi:hypothetical protein